MAKRDLQRVDRAYTRLGARWAWNLVSFAGFQGWESTIRRQTVAHLSLQPGDAVLDVACGRGSNFSHLQDAVGEQGRIVGVDYSAAMLAGAEGLVRGRRWTNVELVQGDAAEMTYDASFDGAICTIAMTVIPAWQPALRRMIAAVRPGKRIAITDGQRPSGFARLGAPYARLFSKIVAADLDRDVQGECRTLLTDTREETRMFGTYFIISGEGRLDV
ncbi:MAG: methyltransferase domain-containing protein [Dehalococcoidia bacterium]